MVTFCHFINYIMKQKRIISSANSMILETDDVSIQTSVDYLKIFIESPQRKMLIKLLKVTPGFNFMAHVVSNNNKNWQCDEYFIYVGYEIKKIYHEYSIEKEYIQLIKLLQPTIELHEYINNFIKINGIQCKLSRIEFPFDIYPKRSGISLNDIKNWVEMHLLQLYIPAKVKEFRIKDTFYTRPTRKLSGQASRGMKVYIKNNSFVRCELELLRPYIKRNKMEFTSTHNIALELSRNFRFVEFDMKKFNKYLVKDKIPSPFKRHPRSMMEIKRRVNDVFPGNKAAKFFIRMNQWDYELQRVFNIYHKKQGIK